MPDGVCRSLRGRPGRVPEHTGSMPERVGHVKLQTKEGYVALLCSDWHSSPGELRIAKGQTHAGMVPMPDSTYFG